MHFSYESCGLLCGYVCVCVLLYVLCSIVFGCRKHLKAFLPRFSNENNSGGRSGASASCSVKRTYFGVGSFRGRRTDDADSETCRQTDNRTAIAVQNDGAVFVYKNLQLDPANDLPTRPTIG